MMFRKVSEFYFEIYHEMSNKCTDQSSAHRKKTELIYYDSVLIFNATQARALFQLNFSNST